MLYLATKLISLPFISLYGYYVGNSSYNFIIRIKYLNISVLYQFAAQLSVAEKQSTTESSSVYQGLTIFYFRIST